MVCYNEGLLYLTGPVHKIVAFPYYLCSDWLFCVSLFYFPFLEYWIYICHFPICRKCSKICRILKNNIWCNLHRCIFFIFVMHVMRSQWLFTSSLITLSNILLSPMQVYFSFWFSHHCFQYIFQKSSSVKADTKYLISLAFPHYPM